MIAPAQAGARGYIALCSRGLVHSRTMESLTDIISAYQWRIRYTHDLPIPDAQNDIVSRILCDPHVEWILFVEEDNLPPADFLEHATMDPVQCVDYALDGGNRSVHPSRDGGVIFCGMGCLLVAADVFRRLGAPWFTTESFMIEYVDNKETLKPMSESTQYGGQDVSFCYALQLFGIPIHHHTGLLARHLRVRRLGTPRMNEGCHQIEFL